MCPWRHVKVLCRRRLSGEFSDSGAQCPGFSTLFPGFGAVEKFERASFKIGKAIFGRSLEGKSFRGLVKELGKWKRTGEKKKTEEKFGHGGNSALTGLSEGLLVGKSA